MRKLFKTILVLLLSINLSIGVVYAENTKLTVVGETVTAKAGNTVQVKFEFKSNPGVALVDFDIIYDQTALKLKDLKGNSLVGGSFYVYPEENYISWLSMGKDSTYTGVFFTATFEVLRTAKSGEYEISLAEAYDDCILNKNSETVAVEYVSGAIVVEGSTVQDINGDGVLNTNDFNTLKKVVCGADTTTDKTLCDLNADSKVDAGDLVKLAKMLGYTFNVSSKLPTVVLKGNDASTPTKIKDDIANLKATFKASDFNAVAAADITFILDNNLTLTSATLVNVGNDSTFNLIKGQNYTVVGNTVKFADVFNLSSSSPKATLELELNLSVKGEIGIYPITANCKMVDGNEQIINSQYLVGQVTIGKEEFVVSKIDDVTVGGNENCFIPYGAAYYKDVNNQIVFLEKTIDGKFVIPDGKTVDGDITVLKCALPAAGKDVTTFASSNATKDSSPAIQFGSYVPTVNVSAKYGTFIIIGDLAAFKTEKGLENEQLLSKIATSYDKAHTATGKEFISFSYNNGNNKIYVGKKEQSKYMWKNETSLQYALRVYNIDFSETYTAFGYSYANDTYNLSTEFISAIYD